MKQGKVSEEEKSIIVKMRKNNKGYTEIAKALGCTKDRVKNYCRRNGLGGVKSQYDIEKQAEHFASKIKNSDIGFEYAGGYSHSDSMMWIRCRDCGTKTERSGITIRRAIGGLVNIDCEKCKMMNKKKNIEILELRKKIIKSLIRKETALKEIHIVECKHCKKLFGVVHRKKLYCSDKCLRRSVNKLKELKKRIRYREMKDNLRFDSSISLKKLHEKHTGICYICENICDYNDHEITTEGHFVVGETYPTIEHVVPLSKGGTHSWDNVKLACWKCNTVKSDSLLNKIEDLTNPNS